MTEDQVLEGLEPIEERYTKKYSAHEINLLGDEFRWMTGDKWARFCGVVLADGSKFLPSVKRFKEVWELNKQDFPKVRRVPRGSCELCKGRGSRSWVQRDAKGKFSAAIARCSCPNGENWPAYPDSERVSNWPQFVRWVGPSEANMDAITKEQEKSRA